MSMPEDNGQSYPERMRHTRTSPTPSARAWRRSRSRRRGICRRSGGGATGGASTSSSAPADHSRWTRARRAHCARRSRRKQRMSRRTCAGAREGAQEHQRKSTGAEEKNAWATRFMWYKINGFRIFGEFRQFSRFLSVIRRFLTPFYRNRALINPLLLNKWGRSYIYIYIFFYLYAFRLISISLSLSIYIYIDREREMW